WKSQLVARLERYKRYPSEAQSRGEHGVAQLAFSVDRSGGVHNARIVRSSGSSILDRETLTLADRAQPLPPPPPEITGSQIPIVVPIRYNARCLARYQPRRRFPSRAAACSPSDRPIITRTGPGRAASSRRCGSVATGAATTDWSDRVARAMATAGVRGSRPSATAFSTSAASVRVGI